MDVHNPRFYSLYRYDSLWEWSDYYHISTYITLDSTPFIGMTLSGSGALRGSIRTWAGGSGGGPLLP